MNFRLLLPMLFLLSACNRAYTPTEECFVAVERNAPVSWLYQASAEGRMVVDEECIFAGRVTANDLGGNFYQTIVIEDYSGAVELNLGFWNTAVIYPLGVEVAVVAHGLAFAMFDGVVQVGLRIDPWNTYRTEPFGSRVVADRCLFRTAAPEAVQPTVVAASELTPELCGRLVRIESALCIAEEPTWGEDDFSSVAERVFSADGVQFAVAVSRYADFATRSIPRDSVSLTGILYRGARFSADAYTLKPRTEADVALH